MPVAVHRMPAGALDRGVSVPEIVVLSGAGLSAASGVPTFRGPGGWWRGRDATELATPEAFSVDPDLVLEFYGARRAALAGIEPNDGHRALARLQATLGADRVWLVTQNVDGLLQAAGRELGLSLTVVEMHGTLWSVRCAQDADHPRVSATLVAPEARGTCTVCGGLLRPDIVWFGEQPFAMDEIRDALLDCDTFVSVGTSGLVYPAASFVRVAAYGGARCIEVNPTPTGGGFHEVLAEGAEVGLPRWVDGVLARAQG